MCQKPAIRTEKDLFSSLPIGVQAELRHAMKESEILTNWYQTLSKMTDVEEHPAVIYYKLTQAYRPKTQAQQIANDLGLTI